MPLLPAEGNSRRQGCHRNLNLHPSTGRPAPPHWLSASFALPILVGATLGYWGVRGQPDWVKLGLLAFTAGILLTVAVEEIVVEAHEAEDSRWASLFLVGGFAVFALLASYFE